MKIFQIIQKYYASLGICSNSTQASNRKYELRTTLLVFGLAASVLYFCYDTDTFFIQFLPSLYQVTTVAILTFVYAIFIFNMSKSFDLISECEELFEQSKFD